VKKMIKIAMLSTGEEVLLGDIVDTNAAWLGSTLFSQGYKISKRATVGDQLDDLVHELKTLAAEFDIVIVNGGLGPTSDDLTAQAAAVAANDSMVVFDEWLTQLMQFYQNLGKVMPKSNAKQAELPSTASIINNPIGTACGFEMDIGQARCFFTPGVPSEFKLMVENEIVSRLQQRFPDPDPLTCHRLYTFGSSESVIADVLDKIELPERFEFGYRSYSPFIEIKLFAPASEEKRQLDYLKIAYNHFSDNVVSVDESMMDYLACLIEEKQINIAITEQFTGGGLTKSLMDNDVIEQHVVHSWVFNSTIGNELAEKDPFASALALAAATREKGNASIGLAVGRNDDGRIAIALSTQQGDWGQLLTSERNRRNQYLKPVMATVAMDMVLRYLENKPLFGHYSGIRREKELFIPST
jgi:competence/damage-inducible protein CinA-like protein